MDKTAGVRARRLFLGVAVCLLWPVLGPAETNRVAASAAPTGTVILERGDANLNSTNRVMTTRMIIHGRRGSRTVVSRSWGEGEQKAFTEYISPPREAGTKMLKLDEHLWTYAPEADRIIQISGHMLRQSVMGSDLSYEDMMNDTRLLESYDAEVVGVETVDGRPCWVVSLKAVRDDLAYHAQRMWVDQERYVPLRQELFGKSGRLLKRTELKGVKQVEDRWYPMRMLFKDVLKSGKGTEFIIDAITFDQQIPAHVFSKASLRR